MGRGDATRQALVDVALRLFTERGFDEVTTAEIAEAAGVAQRTLFRHFPTKLDLLFGDAEEATEHFVARLYAQPPGPLDEALVRAIAEQHETWPYDERMAKVSRIFRDTPSLVAARRGYEVELEGAFREWVAQREGRSPDDYEVRVVAAVLVGARRVCVDEWQATAPDASIVDLARRAIDAIAPRFGNPSSGTTPR